MNTSGAPALRTLTAWWCAIQSAALRTMPPECESGSTRRCSRPEFAESGSTICATRSVPGWPRRARRCARSRNGWGTPTTRRPWSMQTTRRIRRTAPHGRSEPLELVATIGRSEAAGARLGGSPRERRLAICGSTLDAGHISGGGVAVRPLAGAMTEVVPPRAVCSTVVPRLQVPLPRSGLCPGGGGERGPVDAHGAQGLELRCRAPFWANGRHDVRPTSSWGAGPPGD